MLHPGGARSGLWGYWIPSHTMSRRDGGICQSMPLSVTGCRVVSNGMGMVCLSCALWYQYYYCHFALHFLISLLFLANCSYFNTASLPLSAFPYCLHPAIAGREGRVSKQGVVWVVSVGTLKLGKTIPKPRQRGFSLCHYYVICFQSQCSGEALINCRY